MPVLGSIEAQGVPRSGSVQEISDAASAEYQVELAADAMEDESLPKQKWWKMEKDGERCVRAMLPNALGPHSSMSSCLISLAGECIFNV